MVLLIVELPFLFQLPYEVTIPLQAAVAGIQKVWQFNTQVTVVCRKKDA